VWEFRYGICGCEAGGHTSNCNKYNEGLVEGGYECVCHPSNATINYTIVNCPSLNVYKTANSSCVTAPEKLGYNITHNN